MPKTKSRKSIQLKFDPKNYTPALKKFMEEYAEIVNYSLLYVYNVYKQYELNPEIEEGFCSVCEKKKKLTYTHTKTNAELCTSCFRIAYSEFTLRSSLLPILKENYPTYSIYATSYHSPLRHIFGTFKSWVNKQEQRERERKKIYELFHEALKTQDADFSVCWRRGLPSDMEELHIDWQHTKKLKKLERDITFPHFRGTTIRLWQGFAGVTDDMEVWLKNPKIKIKGLFSSQYGDYQKTHITEISDQLSKNYLSIHFKNEQFFLDVPYSREVNLMTDDEILESANKPDTTLAVIVFGLREPAHVTIYQNNQVVERKSFGGPSLWDKKQKLKDIDKNVMKKISGRHDKQRARIQKKKWWKKTRNRRTNAFRDYDNRLSFHIVKYINEWKNPIVLMRRYIRIKDIPYVGRLKTNLMMWSVAQEQEMIEHKLNFKEITVYHIPYGEVNEMICPKCETPFGKTLTLKLNFKRELECGECGHTDNLYTLDTNKLMDTFMNHVEKHFNKESNK